MKIKFKLNEDIIKIIISTILFVIALFFQEISSIYFALLICSYVVVSFEIFISAIKKLFKGKIFDEDTLMIIATISAFIIGEYPEAVMVMLLFEFGEYLSDLAVDSSKESITKLMDLRSDYVNLQKDGKLKKVSVQKAKIGDIFVVKPGEKVPLDGILINGQSDVDTSSLTGESVPRKVVKGDSVLSGFVNGSGLITVRATSEFTTSTASKIIDLLENSNKNKTKAERFITKFAEIYTPIVVLLALLIVLVPTLLGGEFNTWIYRALVFLVTACPCALVISVPLGFFCGVGRGSKEGILIKGSDGLETLAKLQLVVLDKTGTITQGKFALREIHSDKITEDELLKLASYGEYYSSHPIARSILEAYKGDIDEKQIKNYKEISGHGVTVTVSGDNLIIGNEKLLKKENVKFSPKETFGTIVYIAKNKEYLGYLIVGDEIKKSAYNLIEKLHEVGTKEVVILSGDNEQMVQKVAKKIKADKYYSQLLPADKVEKLKEIKNGKVTAFVGDGINDAPVIKLADLGISMGGIGSDAAIEASDIVIMHDDLGKIPVAIRLAKSTQRIVKFNIAFALALKFLMIVLATFGFASIWMAVFADVGVTLIAVLNALRIMKKDLNH